MEIPSLRQNVSTHRTITRLYQTQWNANLSASEMRGRSVSSWFIFRELNPAPSVHLTSFVFRNPHLLWRCNSVVPRLWSVFESASPDGTTTPLKAIATHPEHITPCFSSRCTSVRAFTLWSSLMWLLGKESQSQMPIHSGEPSQFLCNILIQSFWG